MSALAKNPPVEGKIFSGELFSLLAQPIDMLGVLAGIYTGIKLGFVLRAAYKTNRAMDRF